MTRRNTGGFLSSKEQATDSNSANGIFTLSEAAALTTGGNFPVGTFAPSRSVRFRSSATAYLTRTPVTAGNRKTYTWSGWVKRGLLTTGTFYGLFTAGLPSGGDDGLFYDTTAGGLYFTQDVGTNVLVTNAVFRDPAAWHHVVIAVDTTQAIASSRIKLYVNGVQVTSFSTATYPAQNSDSTYINTTNSHRIGAHTTNTFWFDGYLSEVNFIDGQALTPSAFGQTDASTGTWVPKRYSGSYGTNGFYLPFSIEETASLGTSFSSDYLVVGGGGGGGAGEGGGAGGGGMVVGTLSAILGISYGITVGAGGALNTNGGNSRFDLATGYGGGTTRANGGSGGGGGNTNGSSNQGNSIQTSPTGGTGYGYAGGNKVSGGGYGDGGGGGAGGAGGDITGFAVGGNGGPGRASSLSGTSVTYAPGGGGFGNSGAHGSGGSGATGANSGRGGNTGGGGTTGGSGVVIIKIPDTRTATFSGGVTVSGGSASGGFKIYSVTATSTTSETVIFS